MACPRIPEPKMQTTGVFQADLDKYYRIELGDPRPPLRRKLKLWTTHLGLHCVAIYRLAVFCREQLRRRNFLVLPLAFVSEAMCCTSRFIHHVDVFAASIGPGFYIGHVGTIYMGRTSIGSNFSVSHNVTIGVGVSEGAHGLPVIGDDVWVGTGSILYGNIAVGDGVTVNCGSILSRSVSDRCLVGGNPARVILKNYDNSELFRHHPALPARKPEGPESTSPAETIASPAEAAPVVKAFPMERPAPEERALPEEMGIPEESGARLQAVTSKALSIAAQASTAAADLGQMDILRQ